MKMYSRLSYLFAILAPCLLLCLQCKEDSPIQKEIKLKHTEIMKIHDAVMPKMKDIYKLKKSLKKEAGTTEVANLISSLDEADEAMMDWMAGYKKPSSKDQNYEAYLSEQLILVKDVETQMLEAIKSAKTYIQQ